MRIFGLDQGRKDHLEEENRERGHGEGLDQPVDDQCDPQPLGLGDDVAEGAGIDADHHGIDHCPDEHGNDQIDAGELRLGNQCHKARCDIAKGDACQDRKGNPDAEVALKDVHAGVSLVSCAFSLPAARALKATMTAAVARQRPRPPN